MQCGASIAVARATVRASKTGSTNEDCFRPAAASLRLLAASTATAPARHSPAAFVRPGSLRHSSRRLPSLAAAAAVGPEPVTGLAFLYDSFESQLHAVPQLPALAPVGLNSSPISSEDPNHGYTWLTHPTPYNPFRNRADEDSWYVAPSQEQRQWAQDMDLPLWGIL